MQHRGRLLTLGFLAALLANAQAETVQPIPLQQARDAFDLASRISKRDAGQTWGMEACGPMLFADAATNTVVANQRDEASELRSASDGVWTGKLPKTIHVANTAIEWNGIRWTLVAWPLPADLRSRAQLLGHECFHRIQPLLKLPSYDAVNTQLDTKDGRIWLLLEWRALERALISPDVGGRNAAITDALCFREHRRSLFPAAAENENNLEMNEGLAEYTGVRLANPKSTDRIASAVSLLRNAPSRPSFVRSFAYASGPAYGVLLDESRTTWRTSLSARADLGALTRKAYTIPASSATDSLAHAAARRYDGDLLIADESERTRNIEVEVTEQRHRFLDGPVLLLPLKEVRWSFDPNRVTPLNQDSLVYQFLKVSDTWGTLEAQSGLMVRQDGRWARVVVPAPFTTNGNALVGDGWRLQLKDGFHVVPGSRSGDFELKLQ